MYNKIKLYPSRIWLGKYTAWLLKLKRREAWQNVCVQLEHFFSYFPRTASLDEFTISDLADYKQWRLSEGMDPDKLNKEIRAVSKFWDWCLDHGLKSWNPCVFRPHKSPIGKSRLSLFDLKRLLVECDDETREWVLWSIGIAENHTSWNIRRIGKKLRKACVVVNLPIMTLRTFGIVIKESLWSEVIRQNHDKLRDAFLPKAEAPSDTFTDIQIPPLDIRPPVLYNTDYHSVIGGVN